MAWVFTAIATVVEVYGVVAVATVVAEVGVAMTVVGQITDSKELKKIGGILTIAGSVVAGGAGLFGAAAEGGAMAGGEALAEGSLTDAAGTAAADTFAADAANVGANVTADSFSTAGAGALENSAGSLSGAATNAATNAVADAAPSAVSNAATDAAANASTASDAAQGASNASKGNGLISQAGDATQGADAANAVAKPEGLNPQASAPPVDNYMDASKSATGSNIPSIPSSGGQQQQPASTSPADMKGFWDNLPATTKNTLLTMGGQAIGGLFSGWSAEQKLALDRQIQDEKKKQYDQQMSNASAIPTIKFKPIQKLGMINSIAPTNGAA